MPLLGSKVFNQKVKYMKVPLKYEKFQKLLSEKVMCIRKQQEKGPPILTWNQMKMYVLYMYIYTYVHCRQMND